MSISRRGLGALAAGIGLLAGKRAKACSSLALEPHPREFFVRCAEGKIESANTMLAKGARLSVITPESQKFYEQENIARRLHFMMSREGWRMVGDIERRKMGGMYWREWPGWLMSDMLSNDRLELAALGCGDAVVPKVRNVFVSVDFAGEYRTTTLKNIMILESHELALRNPLGEAVTDY